MLPAIPVELQRQIMRHAVADSQRPQDHAQARSDLRSFCLVSKGWKTEAQSLLYSVIDVDALGGHLAPLYETLEAYPALAALVTRVVFPASPPFGVEAWQDNWVGDDFLARVAIFPNLRHVENLVWATHKTTGSARPPKHARPRLVSLSVISQAAVWHAMPINFWFDISHLRRFHYGGMRVEFSKDASGQTLLAALIRSIFAALPAQIDDLVFDLVDASDNNIVLAVAARHDVGRSLRLISPKATVACRINPLKSCGRSLTICADEGLDLLSQPHDKIETLVFGPRALAEGGPFPEVYQVPVPIAPNTNMIQVTGSLEPVIAYIPSFDETAAHSSAQLSPDADADDAAAGFPPTHAVVRFIDQVVAVVRAHPTRFPRLRQVGVLPEHGALSLATPEGRRLLGVRDMARKLKDVGLRLVDDDGVVWRDGWFSEA